MEREAFRQRMQQYKQARESNPQLKYWDWKKYADDGEVKDNTYIAPVYKEQVFIPATGAYKIKNDYQYKHGSKSPYKGGELEIVSPEFDILTGITTLKPIVTKAIRDRARMAVYNNVAPGSYKKSYIAGASKRHELFNAAKDFLKPGKLEENPKWRKSFQDSSQWEGFGYGNDAKIAEEIREESWKRYLGIKHTPKYYVDNLDGTVSYNLKNIPLKHQQNFVDEVPRGGKVVTGDYIGTAGGNVSASSTIEDGYDLVTLKDVWDLQPIQDANRAAILPSKLRDKISHIEVQPDGYKKIVYNNWVPKWFKNFEVSDVIGKGPFTNKTTIKAVQLKNKDLFTKRILSDEEAANKLIQHDLDIFEPDMYNSVQEAKEAFQSIQNSKLKRLKSLSKEEYDRIKTEIIYKSQDQLLKEYGPYIHPRNKYADGGVIDEDPPQNTSERPITNFDPKGDPYNPTYGYNPGAGYVSNSDPLGSLYIGDKVTSRQIKKAIRSLPKDMRSIEAAYLQFATPGQYTKWFNKIPLLSIPGAAMYFDSKEDNSYAVGTDGIKYYGAYSPKQQAYVLPVYNDDGENNVILPEVTITPQDNTDLTGYMQKGDFIKEAMSFTPVGDVGDIYNIGKDIYDKNYAQAALGAGLFFLPDILAKPIRKSIRKINNIYNSSDRLVRLQNKIYAARGNAKDTYQQYVDNFADMCDDAIRQETELLKQKYPETVKKSIGRISLEQFAKSYNEARHWNDVNNSYIIPWEYNDNELYKRLYKDDRSYLQFAKDNNLPFDEQATVDKWIDKQRRAIRGVYSDKPNATIDDLEPMFTEVKSQNVGGDRLRTKGGLYISNSMDIADRFSRSFDDAPGTAAYAILQLPDIDRTLPIEQQLSSLRRRILPYDVLNTHLNLDPQSLMDQGYIGIQAKYATRSGQLLPAYETALFGKPGDKPVKILDIHTSADTKNMHGRWGYYASATDELYSPRYIGESYGDFIHDAKAYYNMLPEYYRNEIRDVPNPIFQKRKDEIAEELYKQRNIEYDKFVQRIQTLDNRLQRISGIKTFDKDDFKSTVIPITIGSGLIGTIVGFNIKENSEMKDYIRLMEQQGINSNLLDERMFKTYYLTKKRDPKKAQNILQEQIKTLKNNSN